MNRPTGVKLKPVEAPFVLLDTKPTLLACEFSKDL